MMCHLVPFGSSSLNAGRMLFLLKRPMEYSIGRFSRKSILPAFRELEPKGTKWHIMGYFAVAGNYVLLMFYSAVSGWILHYFTLMLTGHFEGATADLIQETFG